MSSTVACHEGFRDLKHSHWTQMPFHQLCKDVAPDSTIAYTRHSYVSKAEFKKLSEQAGTGQPVKTPRRKVICKVVEASGDTLKVQSIPRKMTDQTKEHKTYSWTLRDGMRGEPTYYLKTA